MKHVTNTLGGSPESTAAGTRLSIAACHRDNDPKDMTIQHAARSNVGGSSCILAVIAAKVSVGRRASGVVLLSSAILPSS